MANSDKKTNLLSRIRTLRLHGKHRNRTSEESSNVITDHATTDNSNNFHKSQKSFRRSLMKVHTRVKNVFQHKNNSKTSSICVPNTMTSSNSSPRIVQLSNEAPEENPNILRHSADHTSGEDNPRESVVSSNDTNCRQDESPEIPSTAPQVPPRVKRTDSQLSPNPDCRIPKNEINNLINYYWYWGPLSKAQVEERLKDCPDGAFLVRDSGTERYLFTLSFRSFGKLLHTRIEPSENGYSLADQIGYASVSELIEDAVNKSRDSIYCFTKTKDDMSPNYPVRLTLPISRYEKVQSLKYLSRFIIRHYVNINNVEKLPLPKCLVNYLQESGQYF